MASDHGSGKHAANEPSVMSQNRPSGRLQQDGILQEVTWREDNEQELERNIEFSLDYRLKFDQKDRELNVFMQYIEEGETEESDIREKTTAYYGEAINDEAVLQRSMNKESQRDILVQADYIHPFGENGRFETGYGSLETDQFKPKSSPRSASCFLIILR